LRPSLAGSGFLVRKLPMDISAPAQCDFNITY
jgi:hypothetical protein